MRSMSPAEFRKKYNRKKMSRYGMKTRKECIGGCRLSGMGRLHDSIEEANYCDYLRMLMKSGEIETYSSQKTFYLSDPTGNKVGAHRVDFLVIRGGKKEIHEYKGDFFSKLPEYKIKKALTKWCYPDIDYRTVTKHDILF
jgi:hypothetical protein